MAALESIRLQIEDVIQDASFSTDNLNQRINEAVVHIAGGIRIGQGASMHGPLSPPLPDLMQVGTVTTGADAFQIDLPNDYQRNVFYVTGPDGCRINPPAGGGYYDYTLFLNRVARKDLAEDGHIYAVCVRGKKLYYQGRSEQDLTLHYYRKPTPMTAGQDEPDGLPDHLASKLIRHYVCRDIFGEGIEDGEDSVGQGHAYHAGRFLEALAEMINFIGLDGEPFNHAGDDGLRPAGPWNV